jgi:hypothetical protein
MWNSNSMIAWVLAATGIPVSVIRPPAHGRAPGWDAGLAVARRSAPAADGTAGSEPRGDAAEQPGKLRGDGLLENPA